MTAFLAISTALLTAMPVSAAGDDQNPPAAASGQNATAAGAGPAKKPPAPWWLKSATADVLGSKWLFHAEGSASFMDAKGNTDGTSLDVTGLMDLRKGRYT